MLVSLLKRVKNIYLTNSNFLKINLKGAPYSCLLIFFSYLESSEEREDEKICNKFRSNEKSKYPGYMKYRTRAKSFNDCKVDWLKDKKEEFARYGFLYQGRTICDFVIFSLL